MKKVTAVEWLMNEIYRMDRQISIGDLIQQAKEMEKKQIIEAYDKAGKSVFYMRGHKLSEKENKDFLMIAEKYYNETFSNSYYPGRYYGHSSHRAPAVKRTLQTSTSATWNTGQ